MKNFYNPCENMQVYSASEIQKQFWMIHDLLPESPAYNIASVFRIKGDLEVEAVIKSLNEIVKRHEVLRATFKIMENDIVYLINPHLNFELPILDLSSGSGRYASDEADHWVTEQINKPFSLGSGPLFRAQLIRLSESEHIFILVMHHIITDLRSKEIFSEEFSYLYNKFKAKNEISLYLPETQYSDYALHQKEMIVSNNYAAMIEHWKEDLKGQSGYLNLPLDYPRPPVDTENGGMHFFDLSEEMTRNIKNFCRNQSVNVFIMILTAYIALLYRYSGQNDITVGVPLTNRRDDKWKYVFGCFVNMMPIAATITGGQTFNDLLHKVRLSLLRAHRNQDVPFSILIKEVKPHRNINYNPLFQVGFTFEPPMEINLNNLTVEPVRILRDGSQLDFFMILQEININIKGHLEYNTDLFKRDTIERMISSYQRLLAAVIENPQMSIDRLPILGEDDQKKIFVEWYNTNRKYPLDLSLHQLFELQVNRTPTHDALVFDKKTIGYNELNSYVNKLAHCLTKMGIHGDSIVGVYMERSVEMVVALYAILKAGGAYLPLDPELPSHRIRAIVDDAKPAIVLTQEHFAKELNDLEPRVFAVSPDFTEVQNENNENHTISVTSDNLAYVMYTSGSTGQPKGVMITHRGICNRLHWMQEYFGLHESDRILHKTPFGFDVSVWELFWPLIYGGTIVVAKPGGHRDADYLASTIRENNITIIHFVPTMLEVFLREPGVRLCTSLRYCISSGEVLSYSLQKRFFETMSCSLYNLYGPTEASVDVTAWKCEINSNLNFVPIGYPIANTAIYILNAVLEPVPIGVIGELYIGGEGLARGYIGSEDLTREKFIPNPFEDNNDSRLYKTGDLARWHGDGSIEYIGRTDFQVKFHGLRIELGEIESALELHPAISQAVVIVRKNSSVSNLVAYYTPREKGPDPGEIRDFLKQRIPLALIPSHFIEVDHIPITASGKFDRNALPDPEHTYRGDLIVHEAPSNKLESIIASVWKEFLKCENIGLDENFFDAGGHSLLMLLVNQKLRELLDIEISMVEMFQYPTIASLAGYLGKNNRGGISLIGVEERTRKQRDYFEKMKNKGG